MIYDLHPYLWRLTSQLQLGEISKNKSMKKIQIAFTCLALLFALLPFVRAQTSDDATSLEAEAAGLSLLPSDEIPVTGGTFWLVTSPTNGANGIMAPLPCPPPGISGDSFYIMASGIYLVDAANDANASPSEIEAQANAVSNLITQVQATTTPAQTSRAMGIHALDDSGPPSFSNTNDDGGNFYTNLFSLPPINTNLLWLQITNVANGLAYLNLTKATDSVYAIFGTTNLLTPLTNWQVLAEVWPTNETTNVLPFTVATDNDTNLFWQAEDWTGVEINGLPAWWTWLYFGNTDESATNLDSQGNTLLYDYENSRDPNVITFSLVATNNYVNNMSVPVELNVAPGLPSYFAVSVDDTNYENDASWQNYVGTNLVVNLGLTEGWHGVWVGLKGFATNATVTWQWKRLKLDLTPPLVAVTNPVVNTVSVPLVQLQGWANESLSSIAYDISNSTVIMTNQNGQLLGGQFFDTNTAEYTTDYFQCFDIPLANGSNSITIHATDLAGNVTTTNFNVTLDYSTATNPTIQIAWPYDGAEICNSNFMIRGWTEDPAATVTAQVADTNGDISTMAGVVERNGTLWVKNLPLAEGTNEVTLWVTNAAGLGSMTNFNLVESDMTLTLNNVTGDLWQPTVIVGGHISDPLASVWVNGVQGTNNGDGTWKAYGVPVSAGGVASFDLSTTPPGASDPINNMSEDKPSEVTLDSGHVTTASDNPNNDPYGDSPAQANTTWDYTSAGGGTFNTFSVARTITEIGKATFAPDFQITESYFNYQDAENPLNDYTTDYFYPDVDAGGYGARSYALITTEGSEGKVPDIYPNSWYIADGQVNWVLHVGGKSLPGQMGLATVNPTVSPITLPGVPAPAIALDQVAIPGLGKNLGTDGFAYGAVAAGSSVNVTPMASGVDYYNFTPNATVNQPIIFAGNNDLSVTNPEYCVGQAAGFELSFSDGIPAYATNSICQWQLPDGYVNQATNYSATCTTYVKNTGLLLTTNGGVVSCWFVRGSGGQVSANATLKFSNGQSATVSASGQLTVYRPTVTAALDQGVTPSFFADFHEAVPGINLGGDGDPRGATYGMTYTVTYNTTSHASGKIYTGLGGIVQLCTLNFSARPAKTFSDWRLDGNSVLYNVSGNTINPSLHLTTVPFTDSPQNYQPFIFSTIWVIGSFQDYCMFQPDGYGSIYVNFGVANWSCDGEVRPAQMGEPGFPDGLIITTNQVTGPSAPDGSNAFPLWLYNVPE
jgi:hypothetical protein